MKNHADFCFHCTLGAQSRHTPPTRRVSTPVGRYFASAGVVVMSSKDAPPGCGRPLGWKKAQATSFSELWDNLNLEIRERGRQPSASRTHVSSKCRLVLEMGAYSLPKVPYLMYRAALFPRPGWMDLDHGKGYDGLLRRSSKCLSIVLVDVGNQCISPTDPFELVKISPSSTPKKRRWHFKLFHSA